MENSPLISIVMAAYQAAGLIGQTLDSIRAQTYQNWELIIVDDFSDDGTADIIRRYQAEDPRIQYHRAPEHKGKPSSVRNIGLALAQGSLITFADADDFYYPDSLEVLAAPLIADPGLNASTGFLLICDSELNPIEYSPHLIEGPDGKYTLSPDVRFDWERLCRKESLLSLCCSMFTRKTIDTLGPLDEAVISGEDFKYLVSLLLLGFDKVQFVPAYTSKYRTYLGSTTKTPEKIIHDINCQVYIFNWLFSLPDMPDAYRKYKGESLSLKLASMVATLTNVNRKELAAAALWRCLKMSDIPISCKLTFFGRELLRILTPVWVQQTGRRLLNKPGRNYLTPLKTGAVVQ